MRTATRIACLQAEIDSLEASFETKLAERPTATQVARMVNMMVGPVEDKLNALFKALGWQAKYVEAGWQAEKGAK